ncbi:hypothetical protein NL676_039114 [Syzygium grande]|nr:hypothetical protein NL676_039114 [Syzygium grande]
MQTAAELAKIFQGLRESVEHSQVLKKQQDRSQTPPFEFVALEACLEAACSCLDDETKALEEEAYPALDKLTSEISSFYLERVHQIKGRLVALTQRVQKVRDELEHLLQDDGDMAGMYLTSKLLQEEDDNSSSSSAAVEEEEVHELNNDGHIMNLMLSLREYVDDTEDYVNTMLDDKQNNLLQMGVLMTIAILVISLYIVVAGVMGMNITITLWHPPNQSQEDFVWTNGACTIMTILLYVGIVAWYKYKGLLY